MSYRYDEDYEDVPARRVKKPAGEGAQRGGEKRAARKGVPFLRRFIPEGGRQGRRRQGQAFVQGRQAAPEGGAKKASGRHRRRP